MRIGVIGGEARDLVNFRGHLISEMAKAGHTVFGIAPGGTPAIQADLERLGATYVPAQFNRTGANPFGDLLSLIRLWRLFRSLRMDLLLTYEVKATVFGLLVAYLAGVRKRYAMITGRGTMLQGETQGLSERLVRGVVKLMYRVGLRRAHGVFFQNGDDLAFFTDEGMLSAKTPRRIINGSGVDVDHFAVAPFPEGSVSFLFVGRLLRDKGVQEFVDAARSLAGQSARFCILGPLDSNPRGIKAEQVEGWVREGYVEYLGEAKDVRPALREAHALVLPSYGEGTPRSVLEAMSMGRAIVTTTAPGCKETVQDGWNGYMVPVGDVEALASAMARLVAEPSLIGRFGQNGRELAESKYDVRKVTADILDFMGVA